jgi:N-acetylglucosaminyl-diphospho-decaprenol L-rhamnosyltransferase
VRTTVVTVTLNGGDRLARCLRSLAAQDVHDLDVVVVDNGAPQGTADLVAEACPGARVVAAGSNLGFAGGNNLVLDEVSSDYVVLINDDAVAEPTMVGELVRAIDRAGPQTAALSARVLLMQRFRAAGVEDTDVVVGPDGSWVPDPTGLVRLVNSTGNELRVDGFGVDRGWLADQSAHTPSSEVFGFSGAAAILRVSALREVGTFDQRFFMYYEDTDLSWRLRLNGYTIGYADRAVVQHHHSASAGEGSRFFRFHDSRNRLLAVTKNATWPMVLRVVGRYVLTTASIAVRGSQPRWQVWVRVRALGSYLRLLPSVLGERRRQRTVTAAQRRKVEELLLPVPTTTVSGYRVS